MTEREFTTLYEMHRPKLEAVARRYAREEWEDLLQGALIKAWRFRSYFEIGTRFDSWVARIIRNHFINEYRSAKKRPTVSYFEEGHEWLLNDRRASVHPLSFDSFSDEVWAALNSLPDFQLQTILMADVERIPHEEIAEHFGISHVTVKSRLVRTRNKLAIILEEHGAAHGLTLMQHRPRAKRLDGNRKKQTT